MADDEPRFPNSMLTRKRMAGSFTRGGFEFQDLWLLHSALDWMTEPLFRGFVNEGQDDVDLFTFVDEKKGDFFREFIQLKNQVIEKPLLIDVIQTFCEKHNAAGGTYSQFSLVSQSCHPSLRTLPIKADVVRNARWTYGGRSPEYLDTYEDFCRQLRKLDTDLDAAFIAESVFFDFENGWIRNTNSFWQATFGLLLRLKVAEEQLEAAADRLKTVITSTHRGKLVTKDLIGDELSKYTDQSAPAPTTDFESEISSDPVATKVVTQEGDSTIGITIFPDQSVLVRLPGNMFGLIDCGRRAARHIVPYILEKSIQSLSFIAISHWDLDHFGGVERVLDVVEGVESVYLTSMPRDNPAASSLMHSLQRRVKRGETHVNRISEYRLLFEATTGSGDRAAWIDAYGPSPMMEIRAESTRNRNDLSSVIHIGAGDTSFLVAGDATIGQWQDVTARLERNGTPIRANGILLPHHGSRDSMTEEIIGTVMSEAGFLAVVESAPMYGLPHGEVVDQVRSTNGELVVYRDRVIELIVTPTGVFQRHQ